MGSSSFCPPRHVPAAEWINRENQIGSYPPGEKGWQRKRRLQVNNSAGKKECFSNAASA
jgi:hypothetical protein